MRAIITCRSSLDADAMRAKIDANDWLPHQEQTDPSVVLQRHAILDSIPPEFRMDVEANYLLTIRHAGTSTWGIISKTSGLTYEIRLSNANPRSLNQACEDFLADMGIEARTSRPRPSRSRADEEQSDGTVNLRGKDRARIELLSDIVVLEPNSENHAYVGTYVSDGAFVRARAERRVEFMVGVVVSWTLALTFLTVTHPSVAPSLRSHLPWEDWSFSLVERLTTSAVFAAILGSVSFSLHYLDVRRRRSITWTTT